MKKGSKGLWHPTDEQRQKMSEQRRGRKLSDEHRAAIKAGLEKASAKRSEQMRGRKLTPEHIAAIKAGCARPEVRQHMAEVRTGRNLSPEHAAAIRAGQSRPEVRQHMSDSHKRPLSPEHAAKVVAAQRTQEARAKVSKRVTRFYENAEMRERQRTIALEALARPEVRARISAGVRRAQSTKEYWSKRKATTSRPESVRANKEHMARIRQLAFRTRTSRLEAAVMAWLDDHCVTYEQQYQIGWYHVDFYVASLNLVIEANGCYWHGCEPCGFNNLKRVAFDQRRSAYLERRGYALAIVWEHAIKRGDFSALEVALGF